MVTLRWMRARKVKPSTNSLMMRKMRQVGLCSKSNPSLGWMSGAGMWLVLFVSLMTAPLLSASCLLSGSASARREDVYAFVGHRLLWTRDAQTSPTRDVQVERLQGVPSCRRHTYQTVHQMGVS